MGIGRNWVWTAAVAVALLGSLDYADGGDQLQYVLTPIYLNLEGQANVTDISDGGDIVGYTYIRGGSGDVQYAFLVTGRFVYQFGSWHELKFSEPTSVDDSGFIAGRFAGGSGSRGFLYDSYQDTYKDIGSLGGGSTSVAKNIGDNVVGSSIARDGVRRAFLYDGERMHDVSFGDDTVTEALDFNSRGEIVIVQRPDPERNEYVVWVRDGDDFRQISDTRRGKFFINESGVVCGTIDAGGGGRAIVFRGDDVEELPRPEDMQYSSIDAFTNQEHGLGTCYNDRGKYYTGVWKDGAFVHEFDFIVPSNWESYKGLYFSTMNNRDVLIGNVDEFVRREGQNRGTFTHMPVRATPLGDVNCDGLVDFDDIDPFVLAIADRAEFERLNPFCNILSADIDRSGGVNFSDIDGFVECLIGGECP